MHVLGRGVARRPRPPPAPSGGPGPADPACQPGRAAADDHDVILLLHRSPSLTCGRSGITATVVQIRPGSKMPLQGWQIHDRDDPEPSVRAVGPRLRALRRQRGATLAQLSEATGISVSTLSRLESGQRRPTLELLLLLARAHQLPLDELVGAPETGDPRVHQRAITRDGRTFIPLTRRPGGLQAYKMIIPASRPACGPAAGPRGLRMALRAVRAVVRCRSARRRSS